MPGRGPEPKSPGTRRRANAPARGDWTDLPQLSEPVLPKLPTRPRRDGTWSQRTKLTWEAWRQDPATGMYGPAEVASAIDLIFLFEEHVRHGRATLASEIRIRMDGLGLTPKGRRDLRWRLPERAVPVAAEAPRQKKGAQVRRLRAV